MDQLDNIQNLIYVIRGQRVMLNFDLARLYQVETKALGLCPLATVGTQEPSLCAYVYS